MDIPSGQSSKLSPLIDALFNTTDLDGENQFACIPCGSKQNARKTMEMLFAPTFLWVGLSRFRWDGVQQKRIKKTEVYGACCFNECVDVKSLTIVFGSAREDSNDAQVGWRTTAAKYNVRTVCCRMASRNCEPGPLHGDHSQFASNTTGIRHQ